MPPAQWWEGECALLLTDLAGGEILGAGQAPGLCPQVVASCWPYCKEHPSSSIFFWTLMLLGHQDANAPEGIRHSPAFVFLFKK